MAQMIPEIFPCPSDPRRRGEEKVFGLLRDQLPEEYAVFYSYEVLREKRNGTFAESETDFLVFHPDKGFLGIEVKGGNVRHEKGQWFQNGHALKKSPFVQAHNAVHDLERWLKDQLKNFPRLTFAHGVCFPDVMREFDHLPPEATGRMCLTGASLPHVEDAVESILKGFRRKAHGNAPLAAVRSMLMPHFEYGYTLADKAERAEHEFFALTEQQCQMLEFLQFQKRALVQGCAGSGKTLMAIKKAEQLGASGKSVLLLCFNRMLGQKLEARTANMPSVTTMTYHRFCTTTLEQADCLPEIRGGDPLFWEEEIPDALDALLSRQPLTYDAVIVDEAQDFRLAYWASIEGLVSKDGWFYIFYDPGQNLFGSKMVFPFAEPCFPLTHNCRNTRRICEYLQPLSVLEMEPKHGVPEGEPPVVFEDSDPQARRKELARILHELTTTGKLERDEVIVLGGHRMSSTCIGDNPSIGKFTLTEKPDEDSPNAIHYYTPMKFKGLEARAVILLDVDQNDSRWSTNHIYTAASRAKYALFIIRVQ